MWEKENGFALEIQKYLFTYAYMNVCVYRTAAYAQKFVKVAIRIFYVLENDPRFVTSPSLEFYESSARISKIYIYTYFYRVSNPSSRSIHAVKFKLHL